MIINHNMNAMNAHRQMGANTVNSGKAMEKLSSGLRINRAGDDAAGLAISEKMRGQIRGLDQASRNAQDGISLIQTAEGALNETHSILQRMRELAVQSSNDTVVETDRSKIQAEVDQLSREITRISETTEFNTQKLLNGDFKESKFHIGANQDQNVELTINNMDAKALKVTERTVTETQLETTELTAKSNVTSSITFKIVATATTGAMTISVGGSASAGYTITVGALLSSGTTAKMSDIASALNANADAVKLASFTGDATKAVVAVTSTAVTAASFSNADSKDGKGIKVKTQEDANTAITTINNAINTVSEERSKLGAMQNRLEHTIANLDTSSENLQASESRIRDVDMAKEMMNFSKNNILSQAAQAMLAQANQQPQGVLQLLR